LSRKIALRVAPFGNAPYFVGPNWYQIASDYSGAIAFVTSNAKELSPRIGTGFIIRGSALYAPWGDEAVFLTASHVIGSKQHGSFHPEEAQASFPGLEEKNTPINFGEILWERPFVEQGVTVLRIKGSLPFGAKPIEKVRRQEFEHLPDFDPRNSVSGPEGTDRSLARPLATIGLGAQGRSAGEESAGFALFLNNLVGVKDRDPDGKPLHLWYTYVTQPGASGSPVFDIETGDLVAIHLLAVPADKLGAGVSIVSVIAAINRDLGQPN
jgi:hypothetical protein